MMLIVGLGNPGDKYSRHRHNVGFMAIDEIARVHGFSAPRTKFQSVAYEGFLNATTGRKKATLLKPQTFMNESGRAVGEAMRFYKLVPEDVVVLHDELDLSPGKLRVKTGGGAAGHNGLKSIDAHIGNNFRRVRIGIGHPGDKSKVTGHVLGDFSKTDQDWLNPMLDAIAAAAPFLVDDDKRFASEVAQRCAGGENANASKAKSSVKPCEAPKSGGGELGSQGKKTSPFDALAGLFGRRRDD